MPDMAQTTPELLRKKKFTSLVKEMLQDAASGQGGRLALTDTQEGSVLRTLVEVFAREMAVAYEQLDLVQENAWLATARGPALDRVVDLLGIKRYRTGHLRGTVVFSRATAAEEDLLIPAGTMVSGRDTCTCATVHQIVLKKGECKVEAEVCSCESVEWIDEQETFDPGCLHILPRPIAGIEQVCNQKKLLLATRPESDTKLRDRVRQRVRAAGAGTALSLHEAVRSLGVEQVQVLEQPGRLKVVVGCADKIEEEGLRDVVPGTVGVNSCVRPHTSRHGNLLTRVEGRIQQVRPAGIQVEIIQAKPIELEIHAALTLREKLDPHQQQALEKRLKNRLQKYVEHVQIGEPVYEEKVRSLLLQEKAVIRCGPLPNQHSLLRPVMAEEQHCNCHDQSSYERKMYGYENEYRSCKSSAGYRDEEGREGDIFLNPDEQALVRQESIQLSFQDTGEKEMIRRYRDRELLLRSYHAESEEQL
jgi:hypothetical protein